MPRQTCPAGPAPIAGCCLAVLCALMAFNSSRMCNTCHVFTSSRILWAAENGPLRWIRYDDTELPTAVEVCRMPPPPRERGWRL